MRFASWLEGPKPASPSRRARRALPPGPRPKPPGCTLFVEPLDDRALPSFLSPVSQAAGSYPQAVVTADFNRDGKPDLATAGGGVSVLLGNGDGSFGAAAAIGIGSDPASVAVGDFNGDGKMDLGVASNLYVIDGYSQGYYGGWYPYGHNEGRANVLLGDGGGGFSGPNVTDLGYGTVNTAAAARLNGDGFDDFVTANVDYGYVDVLLGGGGSLQGPAGFATGDYSYSVAAGDVNADGRTDLVTANFYGSGVGVLLGDGSGGFSPAVTYAAGGNPTAVVLGDFTGDGKTDVATANYYANTVSVLYGNGGGTLSSAANFATGSYPFRLAAGDFNGDGWLDAATGNSGGGDVSVLINDHSWPAPPAPYVSINDVTVTEGNTGTKSATFTVTLSFASGSPVTVHYATADGSATAGSDYTAASGDVTFAPGETSKTVTVSVLGDRLAEPAETFAVSLSGPTNAFIGDGQGAGTVLDDEPRLSINSVAKKEGNGGTTQFVFTVTLSAAYDQAVTVTYATANGTAAAGTDYQAKTGTVTFAPGQTTQTITIVVNTDKAVEPDETFYVNLSGASSNAFLLGPQGIGTILDDDVPRGNGKH